MMNEVGLSSEQIYRTLDMTLTYQYTPSFCTSQGTPLAPEGCQHGVNGWESLHSSSMTIFSPTLGDLVPSTSPMVRKFSIVVLACCAWEYQSPHNPCHIILDTPNSLVSPIQRFEELKQLDW